MADGSENIGQDDIDALLNAAAGGGDSASPLGGAGGPPPNEPAPDAVPDHISQDDIDALLNATQETDNGSATSATTTATQPATSDLPPVSASSTDEDIQVLISQAEQAIASVDRPVESAVPGLAPYELQDLTGTPASTEKASLDLLRDVELDLRIELGRTLMHLEDVLQLRQGSVVPLDKLAGDPVDVFVNGRLIARGEILVLNENFCVRVAELIASDETGQ